MSNEVSRKKILRPSVDFVSLPRAEPSRVARTRWSGGHLTSVVRGRKVMEVIVPINTVKEKDRRTLCFTTDASMCTTDFEGPVFLPRLPETGSTGLVVVRPHPLVLHHRRPLPLPHPSSPPTGLSETWFYRFTSVDRNSMDSLNSCFVLKKKEIIIGLFTPILLHHTHPPPLDTPFLSLSLYYKNV